MLHRLRNGRGPKGQMIVLFALSLSLILFAVGLVVDGGYGLAQRRASQNASDFASLAGARIVAEYIDEANRGVAHTNGTDTYVQASINNAIAQNNGAPIDWSVSNANRPQYIDANGTLLGYVGTGTIPPTAIGVRVSSNRSWKPFFVGMFGVSSWTAGAEATAIGGYCVDCSPPGNLFPAGISTAFFQTYPFCSGPVSSDPSDPCYPQNLTPGNLNVPGGFGWLSFGCDGYGLGQDPPANAGGCRNDKPFLQEEIGPPSKTFGCCTQAGADPDPMHNRIGSLPGNKVSADCSYYIDNQITVTVPIWDYAGGTGSNAWYHIVGFGGFQITGCSGGKNIEGVWRKAFFTGPVSSTPGQSVWTALGVQLVR